MSLVYVWVAPSYVIYHSSLHSNIPLISKVQLGASVAADVEESCLRDTSQQSACLAHWKMEGLRASIRRDMTALCSAPAKPGFLPVLATMWNLGYFAGIQRNGIHPSAVPHRVQDSGHARRL